MAVSNANGNATFVGKLHDKTARPEDVTMHRVKWPMLLRHSFKSLFKSAEVSGIAAVMNCSTEGMDLPIEGAFMARLYQEMKFEFAAVNVSHYVHQPSFDAATVHAGDHVKDSFSRSFRRLAVYIRSHN